MLYLIGLGLNVKDLSLRALEAVKSSRKVYLENYTSRVSSTLEDLEKICDMKIYIASRNLVEQTNDILNESMNNNICLFIIGTPLFATTHTDIMIRAKGMNLPIKIFHNASILNVMGCCGLYSYSFGRTVSIPFFNGDWKPTSFYKYIGSNISNGLHTLCLLDLQVDEKDKRYMSPDIALKQLVECEKIEQLGHISETMKVFVISRFSDEDESIVYGEIGSLINKRYGEPLHSIIIPAKMEIIEKEHVEMLFNGGRFIN